MPAPKSLLKGFEKAVETARPDPKKRHTIFDEATTGLCVIVSPRGRKTFTLVARRPPEGGRPGKQVWKEVGRYPHMTVTEARAKARIGLERVKAGLDPFPPEAPPPKVDTFNDVADEFLRVHVRKEGQEEPALKSAAVIERQLRDFFRPAWGARPFAEIGRSDVAGVLREIARDRGPVMADRALATLSKLFKLQAEHMPNEWQIPTVGIQRKTKASARARDRVLAGEDEADNDLRVLWQATGQAGTFGAFVRVLLLTAQRRAKVAAMRWKDISEDGVWSIAADERIEEDDTEEEKERKRGAARREKGNAGKLKLPKLAHDIIRVQPAIESNPYVFAARGGGHISGFGPLKAKLDNAIRDLNDGKDIAPWRLHDLRRTSKTLMQRAGVPFDISERVLGHAIPGVAAVYAHHTYTEEKAAALKKLADLVDRIVHPTEGSVIPIGWYAA